MAQHITPGIGPPATAPPAVGHHYVDTAAKTIYLSVGTDDSEDWVLVGGRGMGLLGDGTIAILHDSNGEYYRVRVRDMIGGEGVETYVEESPV